MLRRVSLLQIRQNLSPERSSEKLKEGEILRKIIFSSELILFLHAGFLIPNFFHHPISAFDGHWSLVHSSSCQNLSYFLRRIPRTIKLGAITNYFSLTVYGSYHVNVIGRRK